MKLSNIPFKLSAVVLLALALTACSSGGGAKHNTAYQAVNPPPKLSVSPAPTPAAVISAANAGSTLVAGTAPAISDVQIAAGGTPGTQGFAGLSVSAHINGDNTTGKLVSIGATTIDPGFTLTSTGSIALGDVTALSINTINATTTGTNLSISNDASNHVTSSPGVATAESSTAVNTVYNAIIVAQPAGYTYTQFGHWSQCSANCVTGTANGVIGFFAKGEATAPANIPTSGTYNYTGSTLGTYTDTAGNVAITKANMSATADFAARNLAFSTTATQATPVGSSSAVANNDLNMTGNLSYAAGQNLFVGTVTSGASTSAMSGTAAGRFHGPAAQEVGGIYNVSGAGGVHIGAFVGK